MYKRQLLQGAARGTVYHRILECLDYARVDSQQAIEKQIEELLQEEKISKEAAKVVRSSQISWFVRSAVGKRMKEASALGTLHREQQFVMSIDAVSYTHLDVYKRQGTESGVSDRDDSSDVSETGDPG